ncbi:hypothetical protein C0431_14395 [bacterium]|nr:hypothetical protein [bacterium]
MAFLMGSRSLLVMSGVGVFELGNVLIGCFLCATIGFDKLRPFFHAPCYLEVVMGLGANDLGTL